MEFMIDLKNYDPAASVFHRTAARGIVRRGESCLMIRSEKYGDYKFPGGGLEPDESLEEALAREMKEETGYAVIPGSPGLFCTARERRKGEQGDILEMESRYFFCRLESTPGDRHLDKYEEEYGYQVVWIPLEQAIASNESNRELDHCPWLKRDTLVMTELKKSQAE